MAAQTIQGLDQIISGCVPWCVMNADGNILSVNGSFKTLFRIEQDVSGQACDAVLGLDVFDAEFCHGRLGQGAVVERQVVRDGCPLVTCVIRAIPMATSEMASSPDVVLLFTEVTGLARLETDLNGLKDKLSSVTEELTDFATIVSHDLKAPLRGIKTISDWIAADYGEQLGDDGKEQMGLLVNRVDRMQSLIDGVLEYSRIGRVTEDIVPLDLNTLLPDTINSLCCPDTVQVSIQDNLPTLSGEPDRVGQVFQHLLSNAVKFMDKPQGQIQVRCQEAGEFWQFSIADNGPGIESAHFDRIFKMFRTLTPRDEFESAGVGLTLAKKIVDLYHGRLWVESQVGQGSTFHFTYPKTLESSTG